MVVRILENSAPQPAQRFTPAKFLEWLQTQLPRAASVHSCYEAGPFGYGLHRALVALGVRNLVVQPVCLDEQHTGVNHDQSDARQLALRLDRYVAGNPHALATVSGPTPAQEQKRIQSRQREQLKREVKRVAAQGRSLLLTQGQREQGGWWEAKRWERLQPKLPAWLVERLECFRRILPMNLPAFGVPALAGSVTNPRGTPNRLKPGLQTAPRRGSGVQSAKSHLGEFSPLEHRTGHRDPALEAAAPALRPKGLGGLSDAVVEREIGDWNRFTNRRQVGSYTGLCGGISASGHSTHLLSITKHGNVRLRTALVELAWRLVVWQRDCVLVKQWERVVGNAKASKAAKKKAIVAMARQMAVDLWRWRTGRAPAENFGWTMMGAAPPAKAEN